MNNPDRRRWATAVVAVLMLVGALALMRAITEPAAEPLGEAGSAAKVQLTVVPPNPEASPTTEPAPTFTPDEQRYLDVLHEQNEFEPEYVPDGTLVLIGDGVCSRHRAGLTVPQLVDWVDARGYTSLAAGWIVGTAVRELCPKAGDR